MYSLDIPKTTGPCDFDTLGAHLFYAPFSQNISLKKCTFIAASPLIRQLYKASVQIGVELLELDRTRRHVR
jgi:hypothetical protein